MVLCSVASRVARETKSSYLILSLGFGPHFSFEYNCNDVLNILNRPPELGILLPKQNKGAGVPRAGDNILFFFPTFSKDG